MCLQQIYRGKDKRTHRSTEDHSHVLLVRYLLRNCRFMTLQSSHNKSGCKNSFSSLELVAVLCTCHESARSTITTNANKSVCRAGCADHHASLIFTETKHCLQTPLLDSYNTSSWSSLSKNLTAVSQTQIIIAITCATSMPVAANATQHQRSLPGSNSRFPRYSDVMNC